MSDEDKIRENYDFEDSQRGAVSTKNGTKLPVTLRLDGHIIKYFKKKAGEKGKYQTLINQALNDYIRKEDGHK